MPEAIRVKVTIQSNQLSKEDLQLLIQAIRDCEQKSFPDREIYIWIDVPELATAEATEILTSIKPPYNERIILTTPWAGGRDHA
ncbi:unnamed protein product [marine sediment metagenome]|uniref:Uncharacterized protein n=1 Tax=marine sediment metagenome TaxID=412755 RepID=X1F2G5_9ZZZZ